MEKRILFTQLFLTSTLVAQAQLPKTKAELNSEISRAANIATSVAQAVGDKVDELAKNENVRELGNLVAEKAVALKDVAVEKAGTIAQAVGHEVDKAKSAVVVTAAQAQHAYKKSQADNAWNKKEATEHDVAQVRERINEETKNLAEQKRVLHAAKEELARVQRAQYERSDSHQENLIDVVQEAAHAAQDTARTVGKTVSGAVSNAVQTVKEKAHDGFETTKTLIAAAPAKVGSFVQDVRKDHAEHKIADNLQEKGRAETELEQKKKAIAGVQEEINFVHSQIATVKANIADRDRLDAIRKRLSN